MERGKYTYIPSDLVTEVKELQFTKKISQAEALREIADMARKGRQVKNVMDALREK